VRTSAAIYHFCWREFNLWVKRVKRRDVAVVPKGGPLKDGRCANALVRARTTDLGEGGALYDEYVRLARLQ
jgi:hypothetical protein